MTLFRGLIEFMGVIETGSFSAAARKLDTSVAHISRQIAALETRLGTKLLTRTTRHVKPTAAGEHLAISGLPLLEELKRIQDDMSMSAEALEGTIRVSMSGLFSERHITPQLARFCERHPRIRIDVDLSEQKANLLDGWFDFAVRMGPLENSAALIARRLMEIPMVTCAAPSLVARLENEMGATLSPVTMPANRCLSWAGRKWRFRRERQVHTIDPAGPLSSNSSHVLVKAAAEGLGVIHVPLYYLQNTSQPHGLMPLFPEWQAEEAATINIVYVRNRFMPARVRLLIDYLLACDFSSEHCPHTFQ